uniref:Uncharacterized protein n=1 Tax=Meloidogyne enterolobii TaxID=390850 RepID=A0A6V7X3S0_MELEN|nr:unnamed protein product [Meloidogyne enterolobii]
MTFRIFNCRINSLKIILVYLFKGYLFKGYLLVSSRKHLSFVKEVKSKIKMN